MSHIWFHTIENILSPFLKHPEILNHLPLCNNLLTYKYTPSLPQVIKNIKYLPLFMGDLGTTVFPKSTSCPGQDLFQEISLIYISTLIQVVFMGNPTVVLGATKPGRFPVTIKINLQQKLINLSALINLWYRLLVLSKLTKGIQRWQYMLDPTCLCIIILDSITFTWFPKLM